MNQKNLIQQAVEGLPEEALSEILHFVYFVRKKVLHPKLFEEELEDLMLQQELGVLSQKEVLHLEEEFEGYEKQYPKK